MNLPPMSPTDPDLLARGRRHRRVRRPRRAPSPPPPRPLLPHAGLAIRCRRCLAGDAARRLAGDGVVRGPQRARVLACRIGTNVCLRLISQRPRRLVWPEYGPAFEQTAELGTPVPGPVWIEPLPDDDGLADQAVEDLGNVLLGEGVPAFKAAAVEVHKPRWWVHERR